jgi:hypothetical protein
VLVEHKQVQVFMAMQETILFLMPLLLALALVVLLQLAVVMVEAEVK